MPTITGQSGPYSDMPGAYGGNSGYNVGQANQNLATMTELANSTVQITPSHPLQNGPMNDSDFANYFRCAEESIQEFDTDKNGILSQTELQASLHDDAETAKQFYTAINQDGKEGISPVDMTSYVLAQDGPKQIYANLGLDDLFNTAQSLYQGTYSQEYPGEQLPVMDMDGKASPAERHALDKLIQGQNLNSVAGTGMKQLQAELNLNERYASYRQMSAPPGQTDINFMA